MFSKVKTGDLEVLEKNRYGGVENNDFLPYITFLN